ncbi:MAG: fatty acid CoA ligase family protein [Halobacteria archaeon]|nr:fatty acid CoA ligase family protein [Halobacteria archaeon]
MSKEDTKPKTESDEITFEKEFEVDWADESAGDSHNVMDIYLRDVLEKHAYKRGTVYPEGEVSSGRISYTHMTYKQMYEEMTRYCHGFEEVGIDPGDKVLLLIPPSLEFTLIFGTLVGRGAIPVLIDPGMGIRRMVKSIGRVEPDHFIGISKAQLARIFFRKHFSSVDTSVTIGRRWFWGGPRLKDLRTDNTDPVSWYEADKDETAGIFFTTGTTGTPKGVVYTHEMFKGLADAVQDFFKFGEDAIDMPAFPPFALFNMAFGGTSVIPDMDPSRPAEADPATLVQQIQDHGVTVTYGSPAIWNQVAEYCIERDIQLETLERLIMFGAPVPGRILEMYENEILPNGKTYTPYGATESIFVSVIEGKDVVNETLEKTRNGAGTCVGQPLPYIDLKLIEIEDGEIDLPTGGIEEIEVEDGEVGEMAVSGSYVTEEYHGMPEITSRAKIYDDTGEEEKMWHRMGDVGYLDEQGRLWYCGRKSHRIQRGDEELYTIPIEEQFADVEGVADTAAVGVPDDELGNAVALVVESHDGEYAAGLKSKSERENYFVNRAEDRDIPLDHVLFKDELPVDVRHNAKIKRGVVADWAERQI